MTNMSQPFELKFHEVGYPNPRAQGPTDECGSALCAMLDPHTCLYALLAPDGSVTWKDAPVIVPVIADKLGLSAMDTIFYDVTPTNKTWTRVTLAIDIMTNVTRGELTHGLTPDPRLVAVFAEEVARWQPGISTTNPIDSEKMG